MNEYEALKIALVISFGLITLASGIGWLFLRFSKKGRAKAEKNLGGDEE